MMKTPLRPTPTRARAPKVTPLMPLDRVQAPSPNFDARTRPIRFVVLHYTGMARGDVALALLTDPAPTRSKYRHDLPPSAMGKPDKPPPDAMSRVSCHYLVCENGQVVQLVDEANRAWHAGAGYWDGEDNLNSCSIGIEIANGGHEFGLPAYTSEQIAAVIALLGGILQRHGLDRHHVIGHSDLAPARKIDPGEHFPWQTLAQAGVSIWPDVAAGKMPSATSETGVQGTYDIARLEQDLALIGYGVAGLGVYDTALAQIVSAFQRRFRPDKVDGILDAHTAALIEAVAAILRPKA
ncbi:MAG: hypothetical protein RLZZ157_833 [Pseudomonadota bacterium]|jgi:N-acetylmuramoyl-L-alanine amidase